MIFKHYEIGKINLLHNKFILIHGQNDGLKNEKIDELAFKSKKSKVLRYEEKEIIENEEVFFDSILNGSLFDNGKLVIINRSSDKLISILENLISKKFDDTIIIINAHILDKKSKLRFLFEKDKNLISIAFYLDTNETLIKLTQDFFYKIKTPISFENINIIVNRCNGDRGYLKNELQKVELFIRNKKKIDTNDLIKLTNLTENYSINELIDMCLSKNKKKTINILNENNFGPEDNILIIRTFLTKSKRLLNLLNAYKLNNDLNKTISNAKPPIFWKDKEIIKLQIKSWSPENIREVIYNLNNLEVQTKSNSFNPLYAIIDFILDKSSIKINN